MKLPHIGVFSAIVVLLTLLGISILQSKRESLYEKPALHLEGNPVMLMTQGEAFPGCEITKVLGVIISEAGGFHAPGAQDKKESLLSQARALGADALILFKGGAERDPYYATAIKQNCKSDAGGNASKKGEDDAFRSAGVMTNTVYGVKSTDTLTFVL